MAKNIPFKLILEKAKDYQADMTRFLRDMVAIPNRMLLPDLESGRRSLHR
ncbi:hypothetical protein RF973_000272 [Escherichia coli]|nr:hypothetical protein [Escherichia coli]